MSDDTMNPVVNSDLGTDDQAIKTIVNSIYTERNKLVAALARVCPMFGITVGIKRAPEDAKQEDKDWPIIYIDLPTGQVSWHIHIAEMELFLGVPDYRGTWDGHDTCDKYRRLLLWSEALFPEIVDVTGKLQGFEPVRELNPPTLISGIDIERQYLPKSEESKQVGPFELLAIRHNETVSFYPFDKKPDHLQGTAYLVKLVPFSVPENIALAKESNALMLACASSFDPPNYAWVTVEAYTKQWLGELLLAAYERFGYDKPEWLWVDVRKIVASDIVKENV